MDMQSTTTSFPWVSLGFICLGMLAHSIVFTSPLPYVAFMVVDFKEAKNLDEAGYYAGWITGMFMVGRTIAGVPWGLAADKWGRKVCLIASMVNVSIFGLIFGFSTNFKIAMFMRFCIGLGNGYLAVAKTAITEVVTNKEHEMRAFGYLNAFWGLGMIVGPSIGGFLARPAIQYPHTFTAQGIWGHYPYLLPCLCCSGIAACAAMGLLFFFDETLQKKAKEPSIEQSVEMKSIKTTTEQKPSSALVSSQYSPLNTNEDSDEETTTATSSSSSTGHFTITNDDDEENDLITIDCSTHSAQDTSKDTTVKQTTTTAPTSSPSSFYEILTDPNLSFLITIYGVTSFVVMFIEESFPLWAVSQLRHGGFDWSSKEVGETLAMVGCGLVIYQFVCFEYIMKRWFDYSLPTKYAINLFLTGFLILCLPFIVSFTMRCLLWSAGNDIHRVNTHDNFILSGIILIALLLYFIFATHASTSFSVIINSAITQQMRGTMNGLQMTSGSIGNGLGPILGSMLYAYALQNMYGKEDNNSNEGDEQKHGDLGSYLPLDGRVVFVIGGCLMMVMAIISKMYMK
jgi:MFS family permease